MTINVSLSPYAYAKMRWFCRKGKTEITGFGISPEIKDLLYVDDFITVPQECTSASCEIDDAGLAKYFTDCVSRKLEPVQFMRMWFHTHPGDMLSPSGTDKDTMRKCFGDSAWQMMLIMCQDGRMSATLETRPALLHNVTLTTTVEAVVVWNRLFRGVGDATVRLWEDEYAANIKQPDYSTKYANVPQSNTRQPPTVFDTAKNEVEFYQYARCHCGGWLNEDWLCSTCDAAKIAADIAYDKATGHRQSKSKTKIFVPKGASVCQTQTLSKRMRAAVEKPFRRSQLPLSQEVANRQLPKPLAALPTPSGPKLLVSSPAP